MAEMLRWAAWVVNVSGPLVEARSGPQRPRFTDRVGGEGGKGGIDSGNSLCETASFPICDRNEYRGTPTSPTIPTRAVMTWSGNSSFGEWGPEYPGLGPSGARYRVRDGPLP